MDLRVSDYQRRKAERKKAFDLRHGVKLEVCSACSGSGRYDYARNGRTPKCGSCNGSGKVLGKLNV